jgi:hypothetical protein
MLGWVFGSMSRGERGRGQVCNGNRGGAITMDMHVLRQRALQLQGDPLALLRMLPLTCNT